MDKAKLLHSFKKNTFNIYTYIGTTTADLKGNKKLETVVAASSQFLP
jgi:2-hydroxy-3-keto-5-methylthiopentenyl-1-phosphate phosphatase